MILISVVLVALIGVVMTEGEQEVDKLKATKNEPNNLELLKENTLTGERGDEQALYFSYLEVTMSCNIRALHQCITSDRLTNTGINNQK